MSGQAKVAATNDTTYTVNGVAGGATVVPKGASVKVYDSTNAEVSGMTTTVGEDGSFTLNFAEAGTYTVEVSGTAVYTGSVWDSTLNDGAGGYKDQEFSAAPVIPSRIEVTVVPYASKTVYVSISTKSGEFAVGKGGEIMHYFPVTATDNAANPDGNVTIMEVLVAAHEQYHPDGASAVSQASFITKLWGESNGGNCSYYFNDVYMSGSGSKTGSNGREFQDKLLNTVVEDNDHYYIYSFQSTDWTKGDLYTYFYPVTDTAVAGTAKTFTVKSGTSYGSNKLETSLVKVTDANGTELTNLATTVGSDGSFTITFPSAGTYTVDVRTNGANYVTPARCTVTVSAPYIPPVVDDDISVYVTILGDTVHGADGDTHTYKVGNLETWLSRTEYSVDADSVVWDVLASAITGNGMSYSNPDGNYLESITKDGVTLSEFSNGSYSGWKYLLNDEYSNLGVNEQGLSDGDEIILHYTDDYTIDDDGNWTEPDAPSTPSNPDDTDKPEDSDNPSGETTKPEFVFADVSEDAFYYDAVMWAVELGITNGTSDTTFSPQEAVTADAFFWRAAGCPKVSATTHSFTDVDKDAYYYEALLWAVENGITNGTSDTTFSPNAVCNRGQMATFLYRSAKTPAISGSHDFSDVKDDAYYNDAVIWAAKEGITNGTSDTTFSPDADCTRGQMVTFLYRYLAE